MASRSARKRCAAAAGVALAAAVLSLSPAGAQSSGEPGELAAKPIPRNADGTISFAGTKDDVGNWQGPPGTSLANNVFEDALEPNPLNLPTNLDLADVPFQPWARELYDLRQSTFTKDDPHTRCKPSGGARLFHTPYGFEILQLADTKEIMFLPVGSPHSWRVVHMDGRPLPENPPPSWYGTSVGRWEGDTLVIDTVGFNERFWISREGVPHTAQLRTTERISRPRFDQLRYEIAIDDPGAYTKPWSGGWNIPWDAGNEPFDYLCQDNNLDPARMVGPQGAP
jgi:hypothetical protein